jgi:hypothetical protein
MNKEKGVSQPLCGGLARKTWADKKGLERPFSLLLSSPVIAAWRPEEKVEALVVRHQFRNEICL